MWHSKPPHLAIRQRYSIRVYPVSIHDRTGHTSNEIPTFKELRIQARDYGLPGRSKLRKRDLQKAIAEVRAAGFVDRIRRAHTTGRYSSLRDHNIYDPYKKGRRSRELAQLADEVNASLRANKYLAAVKKKPRLRHKPLRRIEDRKAKPHLHGLTKSLRETLARAIAREGPGILKDYLDPKAYYGLFVDDTPVL